MKLSYKDLTEEEKKEYHRIKHREYRNRNREHYNEIVKKSAKKYYLTRKKILKKRNNFYNTLHNKKIYKTLKEKICMFCGDSNSEAHHYDYSNPLKYVFMCKKCHSKFHQILKITKPFN